MAMNATSTVEVAMDLSGWDPLASSIVSAVGLPSGTEIALHCGDRVLSANDDLFEAFSGKSQWKIYVESIIVEFLWNGKTHRILVRPPLGFDGLIRTVADYLNREITGLSVEYCDSSTGKKFVLGPSEDLQERFCGAFKWTIAATNTNYDGESAQIPVATPAALPNPAALLAPTGPATPAVPPNVSGKHLISSTLIIH
ncbi:hypothetical protein DFJ73DRAFT_780512 [Zopfochytrium polystomum]|nr:hypothetical protein DFJ73DRAFT_780512 [Zopfochytrium polystomum]